MKKMFRNRSFQRKLLYQVALTVGFVFVLTFAFLWVGSNMWFRLDAQRFLQNEAHTIAAYIVRADGQIRSEMYTWNEPHHMFNEPRIDPIFVQVMDRNERELFATQNIEDFSPRIYPHYLVVDPEDEVSPFQELETRFVGTAELYFMSFPLRAPSGETVGFIQTARFVPDLESRLTMVLGTSAGLLIVLWIGLLISLHVRAGRLLRPLHHIARTADSLSADQLNTRLDQDPEMDEETRTLSISFNRLLDRLDLAFSDMSRFTSNAAHQLQTPLTVLKGHVDVALRKDRDAAAYRETLGVIKEEVTGMTRMVRSLLVLSRLEKEGGKLEMLDVPLHSVVRQAVMMHEPERDRIDLDLDPEACVRGNEELLFMVVDNLLDNALKYAHEGQISIQLLADGKQVQLNVLDQGPGIDQDDLALVRERFHRGRIAKETGIPGDGLGLALVDRLVALHGGTWTIGPGTDGQGTEAAVVFPAC